MAASVIITHCDLLVLRISILGHLPTSKLADDPGICSGLRRVSTVFRSIPALIFLTDQMTADHMSRESVTR